MANINIKGLLGSGEMAYDRVYAEDKFEWFKSDEDAYIYVMNTENKRCTRYNAEAQNGKRISTNEYETKRNEAVVRHAELVAMMESDQFADLEEAVEATEESQTTEETQQIAKEFAPKKKRIRKSKDIAYDGNGVTLTAKQVDFIRHLPDTNFWERGLDSALWTDVLADEIGGQFAGKPMTTGAMISTICEKGLANRAVDRINGRKSTFMVLTELGKKVAAELGLN